MEGFLPLVEHTWTHSIHHADAAKRISAKFKIPRKELKKWASSFSSLQQEINDCNSIIMSLNAVENSRSLTNIENVLTISLMAHLAILLKQQLAYWMQRGKITPIPNSANLLQLLRRERTTLPP
jgi:hypothetical protein